MSSYHRRGRALRYGEYGHWANLAGLMVVSGLRDFGRRPEPRMLRAIAGRTLRERQRFVLSLAYPSMLLLTIPFAIGGGLGSAALAQLGLRSIWLDGLLFGVALIPTGVFSALYVATWVRRLRLKDPAHLVFGTASGQVLQRLSWAGYGLALVVGSVGVRTWAPLA